MGYRWYTPTWGYTASVGLVGANSATIELLSPEGDITDRLEEKAFRVTRIVGQYQIRFDQVTGGTTDDLIYIHNRIYTVSGDGTNYFTRDLTAIVDADADMLWNQIDSKYYLEANLAAGDSAGTWGTTGPNSTLSQTTIRPFQNGRMGHVDVKVDRRIEEGEGLLWKTQVEMLDAAGNATAFTAGNMFVYLWLRLLVKEAH